MRLPLSLKLSAASIGLSLVTFNVFSSPWVDTEDPYLKASIMTLAAAGIINSPVNTYPLMYKSIISDIQAAKNKGVPEHLEFALKHVEHAITHNQKPQTSGIKLKIASDNNEFQSFGTRYNSKAELNIFNEYIADNWAFKTSVQLSSDAQNNKNRSFEGSYLAGIVGNWIIGIDQLPVWWGPGNDSALALSNNAVAFPALRLTRHNSNAIDFPILNYLGPISFTTYFGLQEKSNQISNIRTWGMRANFKPFNNLEIGFTRTAQWGGNGRPNDLSTFMELFIGNDNTTLDGTINTENEPGNQLAGADFKFHTNIFNHNLSIYGEIIGEDEAGGLPSHLMYLFGVDASFGDQNSVSHLFGEFVNTFINCNENTDTGNCAYEHHIYTEGYRRYGRSMGSTYDSDAQVLTVGINHTRITGTSMFAKLKLMKLNKDGQNHWSEPHPFGTHAQNRVQIEAGYQLPILNGQLNLQASLFHTKKKAVSNSKTDGTIKAHWEYRF